MAAFSRDVIIRRACTKLTKAREQAAEQLRTILDARLTHCGPNCSGWFIDMDRTEIHRCDECAKANGYDKAVFDEDMLLLPEARAALARVMAPDFAVEEDT